MYDNRRFICMTGDMLNESREITDYSDSLTEIAYEFAGRWQQQKVYTVIPSTQSDSDLIECISNSKQGTKFINLYKGDLTAYPSHSHADSGFIFLLAWWTQDSSKIDRIFRSSGLMRDKWDSRRGNTLRRSANKLGVVHCISTYV